MKGEEGGWHSVNGSTRSLPLVDVCVCVFLSHTHTLSLSLLCRDPDDGMLNDDDDDEGLKDEVNDERRITNGPHADRG